MTMTEHQIWEILENPKIELFRFEGLQDYSGEDGENWAEEILEKGLVGENDPQQSDWWRRIKALNDAGVKTKRIRSVHEPRTRYVQAELLYLDEASEFSGEQLFVINSQKLKEVGLKNLSDFYVVDNKYVILMQYGDKGKYIQSQLLTGKNTGIYLQYKNILENIQPYLLQHMI